ncbi:Rop guanine nucleotide exchange factor [Striga asiatica]|uniref:Rop guanine nucleotide exchange factor n=1 Tax=Striga asiatica TaxID=4170 RepID=A0A5A7R4K7_STRAF|nr:Rop guanine nucleotide exchange factor [Striga asiatica]
MELMKEKFAKLLLGEDMSGGGKGVSSALALSNAITNLAASAFGEQKRLEPMAPDTKARWKKEIDWLLSVTDYIVEFAPTKQTSKDGVSMEECLDNFKDQTEFYYASKDDEDSKDVKNKRKDDKWWIPVPKVPPNGLSEATRKWLQYQKDCVTQILKAAMAINAQVLAEMEIPENYIEALPKNGRSSLGDSIYKSITDDFFDPDYVMSTLDLSTEHKILDLKNRIEASVVIWKRKMHAKDSKSSWGSGIKSDKRELFEDRAETFLLVMKHRFPGLPQSELDISKIQYNKDVGHAILESYSRIIESLAFTVLSRIDDVMQADKLARNSVSEQKKTERMDKIPSSKNEPETPTSKTLLDFMGWNLDREDGEAQDSEIEPVLTKPLNKPENIITNKKVSYIERLQNLGMPRSPTERH